MADKTDWFRNVNFGIFLHYGVYSIPGRGEWLMKNEQIPLQEYDQLMGQFRPSPDCAEQWAAFAESIGAGYLLLTTKHHDGFCLWKTQTTERNVFKCAGFDLVKNYVEACRRHNLKIGLYFSIPDWSTKGFNFPEDQAAYEDFVNLSHAQLLELMGNYGKIDLLWYDLAPNMRDTGPAFTSEMYRSAEINAKVRALQPEILINDRSRDSIDFVTSENTLKFPDEPSQLWECSYTMNTHWGYCPNDDQYKSARQMIVLGSATWARGGTMIVNMAPRPDGSLQEVECNRLSQCAEWFRRYRKIVPTRLVGDDQTTIPISGMVGARADFSEAYLFMHFYFHDTLTVVTTRDYTSAEVLGHPENKLSLRRDGNRLIIAGLPANPPDALTTVVRLSM